MKSNRHSKKNYKHSDIEKSDIESQNTKNIKKDKSSKRRLSIYDEYDDEPLDDFSDFDSSFDEE